MSDDLESLAGAARELHADEIARDAESVAARTAENLFYVACVGQFKRGKSTLINALIGDDLLPTGVVPVTAVITIVRYGATPHAVARFGGGAGRAIDRNAIADYVAEEQRLSELAAASGAELVRAARDRAVRRICAALLHEIEEHRRALVLPLEETERRLAQTQRRVAEAQQALDDLTFLFASEQQKLSQEFARKRDTFLAQIVTTANDEASARTIASDAIESWAADLEPVAEQMFAASTERFANLLRDLGGPELERRLARRRFYFTALSELTGRKMFRKRDPQSYLRRLLETNFARVVNDFTDRFVESRRQLEREVASSLREVGGAAERAASRARETLRSGRQRVEAELSRLDELSLRVQRETAA